MISEGQAQALLAECEQSLGKQLKGLRAQLSKSGNTLGALWELITLYAAVQLGDGVGHEPRDGMPDVLVDLPQVDQFWIEATHIGWREREASGIIAEFIDWIRRELKRRHGLEPHVYDIRVDPPSLQEDVRIEPKHTWAHLRKSDEWKRFVAEVRRREQRTVSTQLPPPSLARISIQHYDKPQRYLSSGFVIPKTIQEVSDHPVWSALRSKAKQAQRWKLEDPLVVCIGSSLSVSLFRSLESFAPGAEAAVEGALYDTSKWHPIIQHNVLRDTSGQCYQVPGATRISAVILVSIEDKVDLSPYPPDHNRIAETKIIVNQRARYPLSIDQVHAIDRMDFNAFPYGPQWETWPEPSRVEWKNQDRIMQRTEPGKKVRCSEGHDGSFDLYIPVEDLTKSLAGIGNLEGLVESIRRIRADRRLSQIPPLTRAEVIPGDPKQRKASELKLTFGVPTPPLVQAVKPTS